MRAESKINCCIVTLPTEEEAEMELLSTLSTREKRKLLEEIQVTVS